MRIIQLMHDTMHDTMHNHMGDLMTISRQVKSKCKTEIIVHLSEGNIVRVYVQYPDVSKQTCYYYDREFQLSRITYSHRDELHREDGPAEIVIRQQQLSYATYSKHDKKEKWVLGPAHFEWRADSDNIHMFDDTDEM